MTIISGLYHILHHTHFLMHSVCHVLAAVVLTQLTNNLRGPSNSLLCSLIFKNLALYFGPFEQVQGANFGKPLEASFVVGRWTRGSAPSLPIKRRGGKQTKTHAGTTLLLLAACHVLSNTHTHRPQSLTNHYTLISTDNSTKGKSSVITYLQR